MDLPKSYPNKISPVSLPYVRQMLSRPCLRCRKLFIGHIVTQYYLDWNQTAPLKIASEFQLEFMLGQSLTSLPVPVMTFSINE